MAVGTNTGNTNYLDLFHGETVNLLSGQKNEHETAKNIKSTDRNIINLC